MLIGRWGEEGLVLDDEDIGGCAFTNDSPFWDKQGLLTTSRNSFLFHHDIWQQSDAFYVATTPADLRNSDDRDSLAKEIWGIFRAGPECYCQFGFDVCRVVVPSGRNPSGYLNVDHTFSKTCLVYTCLYYFTDLRQWERQLKQKRISTFLQPVKMFFEQERFAVAGNCDLVNSVCKKVTPVIYWNCRIF